MDRNKNFLDQKKKRIGSNKSILSPSPLFFKSFNNPKLIERKGHDCKQRHYITRLFSIRMK